MAHNVGRKSTKDWENSFYSLEQRHLSLQKTMNEREKEVQDLKVKLEKAMRGKLRTTTAASGGGGLKEQNESLNVSLIPRQQHKEDHPPPPPPQRVSSSTATSPYFGRRTSSTATSPMHAAPSSTTKRPTTAPQSNTISSGNVGSQQQQQQPSQFQQHEEVPLPDPRLVWGAEQKVEFTVQLNQLYQANQHLRQRLEEEENTVRSMQHEVAHLRQVHSSQSTKLDELNLLLHQAVRERDLTAQKFENERMAAAQLRDSIATHLSEKDRLRSSLEGQVLDLRSRLLVHADTNDNMSRDIRGLISDLKEKTALELGLRSSLSSTETSLVEQRNANQTLLIELRSLNEQLVSERKRNLNLAREAHVAAMGKERVVELEQQVRLLQEQRAKMESERAAMLNDFVRISNDALAHAKDVVAEDLHHFRAAASHWESVAQRMFQDIAQRTATHVSCREECEEAKKERDEAALAARTLRDELRLANAKLNIVWPAHRHDTADMVPEQITAAFHRLRSVHFHSSLGGLGTAPQARRGATETFGDDEDSLREFVAELQQLNGAYVAEIEALKLSNEILQDRLRSADQTYQSAVHTANQQMHKAETLQSVEHRIVERQEDRIHFLEQQVRQLRGIKISPNTSTSSPSSLLGSNNDLGVEETIFDLFVGQMISADAPNLHHEAFLDMPSMFCTIDFLVHETIATKVCLGWNCFFDTNASFRVTMNPLLLHMLETRGIGIQLHQLRSAALVGAGADPQQHRAPTENEAYETVAEGFTAVWPILQGENLHSNRPTYRGSVKFFALRTGAHVASIEFSLVARSPFSPHFKELVESAEGGPPLDRNNRSSLFARPQHFPSSTSSTSWMLQQSQQLGPSVSQQQQQLQLDSSSALATIHHITVCLEKLRIDYGVDYLPLLTAYYLFPALGGQDCHVPPKAGALPSHEVHLAHQATFRVTSVRELFALMKEPLAVFFFDELQSKLSNHNNNNHGSSGKGGGYWGVALLELDRTSLLEESAAAVPLTEVEVFSGFDGRSVGKLTIKVTANRTDDGIGLRRAEDVVAVPLARTLEEELADLQLQSLTNNSNIGQQGQPGGGSVIALPAQPRPNALR